MCVLQLVRSSNCCESLGDGQQQFLGGTSATVAVVGKLVSSHIEIVGTETFKQLRQEVKSIGDVTITAMSCNKMSECQLEADVVSCFLWTFRQFFLFGRPVGPVEADALRCSVF